MIAEAPWRADPNRATYRAALVLGTTSTLVIVEEQRGADVYVLRDVRSWTRRWGRGVAWQSLACDVAEVLCSAAAFGDIARLVVVKSLAGESAVDQLRDLRREGRMPLIKVVRVGADGIAAEDLQSRLDVLVESGALDLSTANARVDMDDHAVRLAIGVAVHRGAGAGFVEAWRRSAAR